MTAAEPEPIDLHHLGRARAICAWRRDDMIIDPGPASCLPALLPELERDPPRVLALTHIHLDHAGATGSLMRIFPELEVWVHELGAPHLADPSRLLASATRLYGEDMDRLWGEVLPAPPERTRELQGGELIDGLQVAYTPGHASHHVSFMDERSGYAFTGDVAGVRIAPGPVLAPTPPPDIDLAAWRSSLEVIESWQPRAVAVTHFGTYDDVAEQLAQLRAYLDSVEREVAQLDEQGFAAMVGRCVEESGADAQTAALYRQTMSPDQSYAGLRRALEQADQGA
jgi:glyoxylase-like metal-dependent hydrolase (beta-lactamase superfamily II)